MNEVYNEARSIFTSIVKGKNFMTPTVIGYYIIKNGACELSEGKWIDDTYFGVTVVQDNKKDSDLSEVFDNETEAKDYIESLKI